MCFPYTPDLGNSKVDSRIPTGFASKIQPTEESDELLNISEDELLAGFALISSLLPCP